MNLILNWIDDWNKKGSKINLKSFEFSWQIKEACISFSDGRELGQVSITENFFGIMQISEENILIKMVFGHEDFEFLGFLFLEFHGCVKDGQAEVSRFLFAELELDQAHFHEEVAKPHDSLVDVVFFALELEESESRFLVKTKFQCHQNFTFHYQQLISTIGSVWYLDKFFESGGGDFLVFGSNIKTCSAQDLIFAFDDVSLIAVFVDEQNSHMESLQFEAKSAWNFDEPTHKNLSHMNVNVCLPLNVVLWNDRLGLSGFDIGKDVLGIIPYFRVEVFGV